MYSDITAFQGDDYAIPLSCSLPGEMRSVEFMNDQAETITLSNSVILDNIVESIAIETFSITLIASDPNIIIDPATVLLSIIDDSSITVGPALTSYTFPENAGTVTVDFELQGGATERDIIFMLATEDDTALSPQDYTSNSVDVTIQAQAIVGSLVSISFQVINNPAPQGSRSLNVVATTLPTDAGSIIFSDNDVQVTITDVV